MTRPAKASPLKRTAAPTTGMPRETTTGRPRKLTREAGRECLSRAVERQAAKGQPTAASSSIASTVSTSQAAASQAVPSTQQATVVMADEHQPTQIDLDLLFERSAKLRGAVAWARSTTFGQDA